MNKKFKIPALFAVVILTGLILTGHSSAVEITKTGYGHSHYIGARFGAWAFTEDEAVTEGVSRPVELSSSTLYAEFFYAHRINPMLSAELSIGLFSQGDILYDTQTGQYLTAAKLYPLMLTAKFYPFGSSNITSFYPYLRAGGGLAYGTRDAISTTYTYYDDYFIEDSEAKFTYALGAGFDWPVSSQIGLNLDFKYIPIDFGEPLAGFEKYSGWELTIGVGYIFQSKK